MTELIGPYEVTTAGEVFALFEPSRSDLPLGYFTSREAAERYADRAIEAHRAKLRRVMEVPDA